MKVLLIFQFLAAFSGIFFATDARAQDTVFTYQGRLSDNGLPASGTYGFNFQLASDPLANNHVGSPVLTNGVLVSNGLFTVMIDFGGVFNGSNYWLEVDVRTNGSVDFTPLSPLQPVTATPYAITAANLSGTIAAAQLNGTLASAQLGGTYAGVVTFSNSGNSFSGNGGGLTNLKPASINSPPWATNTPAGIAAAGGLTNASAFQPASAVLTNLSNGNGGGLTNLNPASINSPPWATNTPAGIAAAGGLTNASVFQPASAVLTNLSNGNGNGLTNLNASALTGGLGFVTVPGFALLPGDSNPGAPATNAPASGPVYYVYMMSTTATNNVKAQFVLPYDWNGGRVDFSARFSGGTNSSTMVTNVVSFSASSFANAPGTPVMVTNTVPTSTDWSTNLYVTGVAIGGLPAPGLLVAVNVAVYGGMAPFSITNALYLDAITMRYTKTNAPNSTLAWP